MPMYVYECCSCEQRWEERHAVHEYITKCKFCNSENVQKAPVSTRFLKKPEESDVKVDHNRRLNNHIKTVKEDVEAEKKRLSNREFIPGKGLVGGE